MTKQGAGGLAKEQTLLWATRDKKLWRAMKGHIT